ncbi:MAG: WXG100 family type VII secretion target [Lachnospiraceae bacterium]|nr:WXG100 family type VII secretion target [Lachnospiraceae bacterium]
MASIKMDPTEMAAKATQLDKKGTEFSTIVNQMESLVKELCGAWDGAASDEYDSQFARLKPGFKATEELIGDLAQQIRDISKIMTDADTDIAKKLKNA